MSDMLSALVHATVLLVFVLGWPPPVFYKLPECTSHRTGKCLPYRIDSYSYRHQ